ncbi:MAG: hypothetical protein ACYC26_09255 [Phycisphaerales bacterium]
MKFKNINIAEQHAEKFVLLVGVLFLLYIVWAYSLSSRFAVDLNGLPTPPAQIDDAVERQAHQLENKLNGPAPADLKDWKSPDYVGIFNKSLTTPLTPAGPGNQPPADQLATAIISGNGVSLSGESGPNPPTDNSNPPFAVPVIPVPTSLVVRSDLGTLDPAANPAEILKAFGSQPPFDVRWVTVAARLDMAKLMEQLQKPAEAGTQPILPSWWNDMLALVDVQVERRMLQADGSWSQPQLVPPMAGRFTARANLDQVTIQNAKSIVEAAKANQSQLVQPTFYAMRNTAWTPPELPEPAAEAAPAAAANLADLQRQLAVANTRLANLQKRRAAATVPAQTLFLDRQIVVVQQNIARLTQQIQSAGGTAPPPAAPGGFPGGPGFPGEVPGGPGFPGMAPGMPGMETTPGAPADYATMAGSLLTQDKVECWANDFSVAPGKTYAYRIRLVFSNPLFHQSGVPDSQKKIADQFTLNSDWSDWSEPLTTIQDNYFFVTAGNTATRAAHVEIWKFYDGLWRKYEDNVALGDPIGKPTDQYVPLSPPRVDPNNPQPAPALQPVIDFFTGAVLVDTDFTYKILVPSLNISQQTLRVLVATDGELTSRTELADKQRRETLLKQIAPDALAAQTTDLDRMKAYKEQQERERAERAGRSPAPNVRTPGPGPAPGPGNNFPPPDFNPAPRR